MNHLRHRLTVVSAALVLAASCAAPKPSRFVKAFAPPVPAAPGEVYIADPPPNIYLSNVTPIPFPEQARIANLPTPSDLLIARADDAYQRGKTFYQSGDQARARRQFDRA